MPTKTDPRPRAGGAQRHAAEARGGAPRGTSVRNFARHYAEMLIAMFFGMAILGFPLAALLKPIGVDVAHWDSEAPALLLLGMAFTMTVPMVAWMRHRGHRWVLAREMTAAMFVPTLAAIVLLWASVETDIHALLQIQHLAMLPSMLAAMLLRRREYAGA